MKERNNMLYATLPWIFRSLFSGAGDLLVGVLAEDVLDDDDGLLDHVVDLGLDEVQQRADAALR